jgi:hypothetical protein
MKKIAARTEPNSIQKPVRPDLVEYREKYTGKIEVHNGIQKLKFFIEINKLHNRSTEINSLPPSFDY